MTLFVRGFQGLYSVFLYLTVCVLRVAVSLPLQSLLLPPVALTASSICLTLPRKLSPVTSKGGTDRYTLTSLPGMCRTYILVQGLKVLDLAVFRLYSLKQR